MQFRNRHLKFWGSEILMAGKFTFYYAETTSMLETGKNHGMKNRMCICMILQKLMHYKKFVCLMGQTLC